MTYRLTRPELAIIRKAAETAAHQNAVRLEVGERFGDLGISTNILLAGTTLDDTDLNDFVAWTDFIKTGVELTPEGAAVVDFYVTETTGERSLATNVQAYIEGRRLTRVAEGRATLWILTDGA